MSGLSRKLMAQKVADQGDDRREDEEDESYDTPDELRAREKLKQEAGRAGSLLTSDGKGGLRPSLVLGVMRRDKYRCKVCGELGSEKNGGIGVHHKWQHIRDPKERGKGIVANREGRRNDPNQLSTICAVDHDRVHGRDRAQHPDDKDADETVRDDGA